MKRFLLLLILASGSIIANTSNIARSYGEEGDATRQLSFGLKALRLVSVAQAPSSSWRRDVFSKTALSCVFF